MTEREELERQLWRDLERERDKIARNPKIMNEGAYGEAYQKLVRNGFAQQLRQKYRGR